MDIREVRAALSFSQQIDIKFLRKYGTSTKMHATSKEGWGKWYQADSLFMVYSGSDDILQSFKARGGGQNETAARRHIEALELGMQKVSNEIREDHHATADFYSSTTPAPATFSSSIIRLWKHHHMLVSQTSHALSSTSVQISSTTTAD
jgi:hypothetical protein